MFYTLIMTEKTKIGQIIRKKIEYPLGVIIL